MARQITKQEKKNRDWFKAEIGKRLEALGAVKRGEEKCYPYLLVTSIGPLEVAPEDDWVACVWTDLEARQRGHRRQPIEPLLREVESSLRRRHVQEPAHGASGG